MESQTQRRCAYDARNHSKNRKSKRRFGRRADFDPLLGRKRRQDRRRSVCRRRRRAGRLALEGEAYTDVTLQITNGEITGSSCEAVAAHFAGLPRENRIVCELGPGMNPNVTDLCGYTLLDEKMAGTFHIAVGANTMFGGEKPGDGPCRLRRPRRSGGAGMTGKKTAEMDRWLEEKIRRCGRRSQTLRADDRADEAAFEKIRANVHDIFRTVLSVAEKPLARDTTGYWRVKPE